MPRSLLALGPPFAGQVSNANPHALPANAAQSQTNIGIYSGGTLEGRGGMLPTAFANAISAVASNVVACCAFNRPEARYTIYLLAGGQLKCGRDPT